MNSSSRSQLAWQSWVSGFRQWFINWIATVAMIGDDSGSRDAVALENVWWRIGRDKASCLFSTSIEKALNTNNRRLSMQATNFGLLTVVWMRWDREADAEPLLVFVFRSSIDLYCYPSRVLGYEYWCGASSLASQPCQLAGPIKELFF